MVGEVTEGLGEEEVVLSCHPTSPTITVGNSEAAGYLTSYTFAQL